MSLSVARLWIGGCAWLVTAGWMLSVFGALNRAGYAVALVLGLAVLVWRIRSQPARRFRMRRFRRGFPLAFAVLFGAVVLGGLLYFPPNYDALSYRVPRVLHWLAEGRWHWIESEHVRLNTRATGVEWMMAPLLLFLRSERWVWLFNAAMLAMLPGLIYSAYVAAGGRRRVAWHLMWLLPSGYVFVVQAGGDSNDLPGAFFALVAVALALHARRSQQAGDLLLSMIAIALAVGSKVSNAPLALVWLVAAWPSWKLALRRWQLTTGAAIVAAVCSFLPNAILNVRHCGEWSGASLEFGESIIHGPAWVHVVGNAISLTVQNLTPPVFPFAGTWNAIAPRFIPPTLAERLAAGMDEGEHLWTAYEIPTEDSAALGPLVVVLLGTLLLAALNPRRFECVAEKSKGSPARQPPLFPASTSAVASHRTPKPSAPAAVSLVALRLSPLVAFAVFLIKMTVLGTGRLSAPYYLLLPLCFIGRHGAERVVRARWWRGLGWLHLATALLVLVISPARPLWPALTVLSHLPESLRARPLVQRAALVYTRYRERPDALAPVRALLPADAKTVGLISINDLEASLWRPFGARRFLPISPDRPREWFRQRGIEYIVVSERTYVGLWQNGRNFPALEQWVAGLDGELAGSVVVASTVGEAPYRWHAVRLKP
jgi:hypothetical protein